MTSLRIIATPKDGTGVIDADRIDTDAAIVADSSTEVPRLPEKRPGLIPDVAEDEYKAAAIYVDSLAPVGRQVGQHLHVIAL